MVDRRDPQWAPDERTVLEEFLRYSRDTIELKTQGLSDAQAAAAVCPPSMLTLTGLVRHLAEVERNWFQRRFRGDAATPIYYTDERPDGDLEVEPTTSLAESVRVWRREVAVSDDVLAACSDLDEIAATDSKRHGERPNMRWILVHMIEEYQRHCGHADLLRERIDGVVGD